MYIVSTFGDKPSSNILGQEFAHIAMDSKVSENTRQFIQNNFYVDDGITNSGSKLRLLNSFSVKHILLNFQQSTGLTSAQNLEHCLGIVLDFEADELMQAWKCLCQRKYEAPTLAKQSAQKPSPKPPQPSVWCCGN